MKIKNPFKLFVILFPLCCSAFQSAYAAQPLATGTFWQLIPGRLATWSDEQLAAEVANVKKAGMDTIIIHYTANWNEKLGKYQTFVPNGVYPLFEGLEGRHPLRAIFREAEKQDVKIILGDYLAPPNLRYTEPERAFGLWLSPEAEKFRRALLEEFKDSSSLAGYYIANEPNPHRIQGEDGPKRWIEGTRTVARLIKSIKPDLKVIHSIGLYAEWHPNDKGEMKPSPPSREYLDAFWRPWVTGISEVDAWMIIDGVGTMLSTVRHTDMAQAWGKELAHSAGKEYWVDVENAVMNSRGYYSFSMDELEKSLRVAAKHADKIVLFEHLNYMSPGSTKETARKLYDDYLKYRESQISATR